eukprot:TRINITY_DN42956_c0_g1_i1.p1 TRINITY_DN42956_c0_g1~~TRINITY_DN42956_c0_g1_i1.p1  ORF type:complete len:646 (-),score=108.50 TRINITY_DN42956_c0_g1_i1:71-2008(-)
MHGLNELEFPSKCLDTESAILDDLSSQRVTEKRKASRWLIAFLVSIVLCACLNVALWSEGRVHATPRDEDMVELSIETSTCGVPNLGAVRNFGQGSSSARMEDAGWVFSWSNPVHRFRPADLLAVGGTPVPTTSYYGWDYPGSGILSLKLLGNGIATVDFGNAFSGKVIVVVDGQWKADAFARDISKVVSFPFTTGTILEIKENDAIMVLNDISFICGSLAPAPMYCGPGVSSATPFVCGVPNVVAMNNFGGLSSAHIMEQAGWKFSWEKNQFRTPGLWELGGFPAARMAYYGWDQEGDGVVSRRLYGRGEVSVHFGNALLSGVVTVILDRVVLATAQPRQRSEFASGSFSDGSLLELKEHDGGILLSSISFNCDTFAAPAPAPDAVCGHPRCALLNNVGTLSSIERMERAGWMFSWSDDTFQFRPSGLSAAGGSPVPASSYYGWSDDSLGVLSVRLSGAGVATVDFGNAGAGGSVTLVVDAVLKATATAQETSKPVAFPFHDGTLIELGEESAVIVLNNISFVCGPLPPPPPPAPAPPPTALGLAIAGKQWKLEMTSGSVACGKCSIDQKPAASFGRDGWSSARESCALACIAASNTNCTGFLFPNPGDGSNTCRLMGPCTATAQSAPAGECWSYIVWDHYDFV